jgi:DNA mismatch endonuclease, patch repair protein
MPDVLTSEQRRLNMSRIRGRNTKPEILLRRGLHAKGLRFRLYRKDLPGSPDLTFPRFHAVIFVHGCFWHGHGCHLFHWPSTNKVFWRQKVGRNIKRDEEVLETLTAERWRVCEVWECALRGSGRMEIEPLLSMIKRWLHGKAGRLSIPDKVRKQARSREHRSSL